MHALLDVLAPRGASTRHGRFFVALDAPGHERPRIARDPPAPRVAARLVFARPEGVVVVEGVHLVARVAPLDVSEGLRGDARAEGRALRGAERGRGEAQPREEQDARRHAAAAKVGRARAWESAFATLGEIEDESSRSRRGAESSRTPRRPASSRRPRDSAALVSYQYQLLVVGTRRVHYSGCE